ncbi:MAG: hypothetical protein LIO99_07655 [Clostridiales bacterium]|nr:hypothetical protein [Clostridiales bacterium]
MKLLHYARGNSFLKLFNSKFGTFLLIILVTCWSYDRPLKSFVINRNYPVNWCVFPFLLCSYGFLILFWFGIIYINTDVPFMQHVNMYHVIRTGRKRWAIGQIWGIMTRSFIAVGFTVLSTMLPFIPYIEWTNDWGKLLRTAALTNASEVYGFQYVIYYDIFNKFTPIQLMVICFLLCWLISTLIGIMMFLLCLIFGKIFSVASASALAIMIFPVLNLHPKIRNKLTLFVPTVWAEVARIATSDYGYYWLPSISYMFGFLLVGIFIMSLIIVIRIKHVEFYWVNEDL